MQQRRRLMNDFVVEAKTHQNSNRQTDNEYYTHKGKEDFVDANSNLRRKHDDQDVAAKKIYRDDSTYRLMIKCDRYGKPFDPNDQIAHPNKTASSYRTGYKFVEVGQKAFGHYIKYLNTNNKAWLLNTERELT